MLGDTPLPKAVDRDQSKARTLLVPLSSRLGACRGRHAPGCRGRRGHCGRGSSAHLAVDLAVDAEGSGEHTREIVGPVRHDHLVGRRVSVSGPRSRVVVRVRERVRIGVWARGSEPGSVADVAKVRMPGQLYFPRFSFPCRYLLCLSFLCLYLRWLYLLRRHQVGILGHLREFTHVLLRQPLHHRLRRRAWRRGLGSGLGLGLGLGLG